MMKSALKNKAAGFVSFLRFNSCCFFLKLLFFNFFSLFLVFLSLFRVNIFYSFLRNLLMLIANFNPSLQSQVNRVCEVQLVHAYKKVIADFA